MRTFGRILTPYARTRASSIANSAVSTASTRLFPAYCQNCGLTERPALRTAIVSNTPAGSRNPSAIGVRLARNARAARPPDRRYMARTRYRLDIGCWYAERRRGHRSSTTSTKTNANSRAANCAAATRSPIPNHVR